MKNQMCSRTVDEVNMTTDAGRVAGTVRALVRLCIAPGCAVAFRGPRETCPCCGGPSEPAKPAPPQPERGAGALCRECAHRGACPPGADLRRVTSGGEADDECCWEYQPNENMSGAR
jgi:hypothetical protein